MQGVIDLGKFAGLSQQPYGDPNGALVQHSTNDPLICSSGSVSMSIADLEQPERFPNAVAMFRDAGFTDGEIEDRTYFCMAYNEAALRSQGGYAGYGWNGRTPIYIPPGCWFTNSELRSGQHRNIGAGKGFNAGQGATQVGLTATDWKSIHGTQNDNIRILFHCWTYAGEQSDTPQPLAVSQGYEYQHFFTVEEMSLLGTGSESTFWSPSLTEIGVMVENAGERCDVKECRIDAFRGFGVLISKNTARPKVMNCSMFDNSIAAIGQRAGLVSQIIYDDIACDNNPYILFLFRPGSNVFGTGPFLSHDGASGPGGIITFRNVKGEGYACRSGYNGAEVCQPSSRYGRGQMWAHLTGRFHFTADMCTLNMHGGSLWTAIEVSDQDAMNNAFPGSGYQGGFQLDNSSISILKPKMYNVKNWMADWGRQRVHPIGPGSIVGDHLDTNFHWENDYAAAWTERPTTKLAIANTAATYRGTQPWISNGQPYAWTGGTPGFNYHPVTGTNF